MAAALEELSLKNRPVIIVSRVEGEGKGVLEFVFISSFLQYLPHLQARGLFQILQDTSSLPPPLAD